MRQGCRIQAYTDVFMASPGKGYRRRVAPPSYEELTGKYLQRVLEQVTGTGLLVGTHEL